MKITGRRYHEVLVLADDDIGHDHICTWHSPSNRKNIMSWIKLIFAAFFEALFKLIKKEPQSMEYGESGGEFEDDVKDQIDDQIPDGPGGSK